MTTIKLLTLECKGVACISARNDAAGLAMAKVSLEDVDKHYLIQEVINEIGILQILDHIDLRDINNYLNGGDNG